VSILVLARDEEVNLPDCLHSVCGWAQEVYVVLDPRTNDSSRAVAESYGAKVEEHLFEGYASQKNWAIDNLPWKSEWILIVDADERVPPDFLLELSKILDQRDACEGYCLRKKFIFYGRWMRHCWYSSWDLRLFKRGMARYEERQVHEHMAVDGRLGYFEAGLIHNDFKNLDSWISKHNRYATLEAAEEFRRQGSGRINGKLFGTRLERRRFLKERIWKHLPFRPLWHFSYFYFVKLGILDGSLGLRFCLWHAIFEAFVTSKLWELELIDKGRTPNYYREELAAYLKTHPEERHYYHQLQDRQEGQC
jgi:glycosyltransferase involved in cell wall biosynthesis